jgi:hypothetical protein
MLAKSAVLQGVFLLVQSVLDTWQYWCVVMRYHGCPVKLALPNLEDGLRVRNQLEQSRLKGSVYACGDQAILAVLAVAALGAAVVKISDKDKDIDDAAHGAYKDAKHKAKEIKKDIKDAFK